MSSLYRLASALQLSLGKGTHIRKHKSAEVQSGMLHPSAPGPFRVSLQFLSRSSNVQVPSCSLIRPLARLMFSSGS